MFLQEKFAREQLRLKGLYHFFRHCMDSLLKYRREREGKLVGSVPVFPGNDKTVLNANSQSEY